MIYIILTLYIVAVVFYMGKPIENVNKHSSVPLYKKISDIPVTKAMVYEHFNRYFNGWHPYIEPTPDPDLWDEKEYPYTRCSYKEAVKIVQKKLAPLYGLKV